MLSWVGGLLLAGYVLPLFVPPGPMASPRLGLDAGLWRRLFPHVPGWWMAGRLVALALGAGVLAWVAWPRMRWAARTPEAATTAGSPEPPGALDWAMLAWSVGLALLGVRAALLSRWAQAAMVVALGVPPLAFWVTDRQRHVGHAERAEREWAWLTALVVVGWLAMRIVPASHDPRAADFVDTWKNFTILAKAAADPSGAVTQASEVGVSNTYLLFVGLPVLGPDALGPTFIWVQRLHAAWIALTAWGVACLVRRFVGAWAMAPAVATMLFSPFMLSMAVSLIPFGIATAFGAMLLLLVLRIREAERRADIAAFGAIAGFAILFPHLAIWTIGAGIAVLLVFVRRRPSLVTVATATCLALASIVPVLVNVADLAGMQSMYLQPRAVVAELEPIIMGQRYLPYRDIGALWYQGVRGLLDVPLATLLQPFAILRTPVRLSGDVYFEPVGAALAAVGMALALGAARKTTAARVLLLALGVAMLPGLLGSAFDRASLTRTLVVPVVLPLFTAVGLDVVHRLAPGLALARLTVAVTVAVSASGIVLFDVVNPKIVAGSWLGLTLQALGTTPADRVVVLEHGNPRWEWLYAPEIMRHMPAAPVATRPYRNAGILLADPERDAPIAEVLFWSPALDEEEAVARTVCACWPDAELFTIRDAAGLSRVLAARLGGGPWTPAIAPARWTVTACAQASPSAAACEPVRARAFYNRANALAEADRVDDAIAAHQEALRRDPSIARAHNDLGVLLDQRGDMDGAILHYREALRLAPDDALARLNLGAVLTAVGRHEEAAEHYVILLDARPDMPEALVGLAAVFEAQGRIADAVKAHRAALASRPAWPPAALALAWLLATSDDVTVRNPNEAVILATAASDATGGRDVAALRTLAVALAAVGRFDDALAAVEQALRLVAESGQSPLRQDLEARRLRYRERRP